MKKYIKFTDTVWEETESDAAVVAGGWIQQSQQKHKKTGILESLINLCGRRAFFCCTTSTQKTRKRLPRITDKEETTTRFLGPEMGWETGVVVRGVGGRRGSIFNSSRGVAALPRIAPVSSAA